jgi:glycerol transport system ATP-binding protein
MLVLRDMPLRDSGIDHVFGAGAITVVLGRNRSGKTRLCRLIAGLETPARGAIELDGADITVLSPGRRSVALVYQAFVNYPNLTVFDNIASPLRAARVAERDVRERVEAIARRLQLAALLERRPAALSGGQQQRVAIGRALAKSARVLLLDEPLVNLDYKLREALELELREILHAEDLVVIYTTSDPRDAFNLGDRLVLLDDHRFLQAGTPIDLYEHPVSPAAANLMSDPGVNVCRRAGARWIVRPEHLSLRPPSGPAVSFSLRVLSVETNGSETYLHGTMEGERWVAKLNGLHAPSVGDMVMLHLPQNALLEFAAETCGV